MAAPREKEGKSSGHVATMSSAKSIGSNKEVEDATQLQQLIANWEEGTLAEKKLTRKLDWRILPCTWVLYTLGYLDRANIGNAKTGGMEDDFNLTSEQWYVKTRPIARYIHDASDDSNMPAVSNHHLRPIVFSPPRLGSARERKAQGHRYTYMAFSGCVALITGRLYYCSCLLHLLPRLRSSSQHDPHPSST
jgi:hypothetical protein